MIKRFLRWLLGATVETEKKAILAEAREILETMKTRARREYVFIERADTTANSFLYGIQPLFKNKYVKAWLAQHREQCLELMKSAMAVNDNEKVLRGMAQITMIDSLFLDLEQFEENYEEMLERINHERDENE